MDQSSYLEFQMVIISQKLHLHLTLKEEQLPLVQPVSPLNEKITKPRFLIKLAKSLTGIRL